MNDCLGWVRIEKRTNKAHPEIFDTWHKAVGDNGISHVNPKDIEENFYIVPVVVHKDYC